LINTSEGKSSTAMSNRGSDLKGSIFFPVNVGKSFRPCPNKLVLPSLHQNSDLQQEATTQSKLSKIRRKK
jgi:hypothetical protein